MADGAGGKGPWLAFLAGMMLVVIAVMVLAVAYGTRSDRRPRLALNLPASKSLPLPGGPDRPPLPTPSRPR
jgi:hypothetical protein